MNTIPLRKAFTDTILELAKKDRDIIVLTTDARGSVTLDAFAKELPGQFVEIGIAEQNSVGMGSGLALSGKKVFVCGPSCFLTARSLEQLKVDVAYTHTNVKIIGVSGGVSYGALGTSHHTLHDIAVMRAIEGIRIVLPCDIYQTVEMTKVLTEFEGPVYVRMGRNAVPNVYTGENAPFILGKANILLKGNDITLIGTGETVRHVLDAGLKLKEKGIEARVIDLHTIKPFDKEVIYNAAEETGRFITVEEHSIFGGMGGAVAEFLSQELPTRMKILGIPDEPVVSGTSPEVFQHYGLTCDNIVKNALEMMKK